MERIAITGMGLISAAGPDAVATEQTLRASRSGIGALALPGVADLPVSTAGQIEGLAPANGTNRSDWLLKLAVGQALDSAGLSGEMEADIVLGTTLGGMNRGTAYMRAAVSDEAGLADPFLLTGFLPACQPARLAGEFGMRGRSLLINNACASGNDALGLAMERLHTGRADRVLAGGYEPLGEFIVRGFASLMIVSSDVCRPFDRFRKGLVLGEGAAVFLLERESDVRRAGRKAHAFLCGYGGASDSHHMTQPDPDGGGISRAMTEALARAGKSVADVDYVNLHGTGTLLNDPSEYRGLKQVFKDRLDDLSCSSTKGIIGHTLGAAGALEAAFCIIAMNGGFVPPNVGWQTPDAELDGFTPTREPVAADLSCCLSNSIGFGGGSSAVVLERGEGDK